jgi:predicted NUDIX family NTP pyrophosphohydrolase
MTGTAPPISTRSLAAGAVACLLAHVGGCSRPPAPSAAPAAEAPAWFTDIAEPSGLDIVHDAGATDRFRLPEIMGPGCALLDYDGDGDLDVYALQGFDLEAIVAGGWTVAPVSAANRLYRNDLDPETGAVRFVDVTASAGVGHRGYATGCATGDYDGDGDPDLLVTNYGPNVLLRNNGDGTFTDTSAALPAAAAWSTSAAFIDYDTDGDLDLYVANYVSFSLRDNPPCFGPGGARDYCGPQVFDPVPDRLLRNDGDRFVDATREAGITAARARGLGVCVIDADGDGRLDVYVANDGDPNQLWMNRGDGTFVDRGLLAGAALNADAQAEAGMGVTGGDFDLDGDDDLFLAHLVGETNTLLVNDGKGYFTDRTDELGLGAVSRRRTGFGVKFADLDNDGLLDLYVANGAVAIDETVAGEPFPYRQGDQLLVNTGPPTFAYRDATTPAGVDALEPLVSRGAAFGDVDNDGDVDILLAHTGGPLRLLRNDGAGANDWIGLDVRDARGAAAHGALVTVHRDRGPPLRRRVGTDGSYASASDPRLCVGLGNDGGPVAVEVAWPDGARRRFDGLAPRRYHALAPVAETAP